DEVNECLSEALVGLVILHPEPNYVDLQSTKLFEHMGAGIPSIASNFPSWLTIVDEVGCGICVDPLNPTEVAAAIDYLVARPELAAEMGRKGRAAVVERFNWEIEEQKMLSLYNAIGTALSAAYR